MDADFFKFPPTPHLLRLPGADVRRDKVLLEGVREEFLQHELIVEEKIDGANMGISFSPAGELRAQNRGGYLLLPSTGQWKNLQQWLKPRSSSFADALSDRCILFGEWCYARHSILYDRLPDWFLGFDIYDRAARKFLSSKRRDAELAAMGVAGVPRIARGRFAAADLESLLPESALASQSAEGIYLRYDRGDWLGGRAKIVRPEFTQGIEEHWSRAAIRANRLQAGGIPACMPEAVGQ